MSEKEPLIEQSKPEKVFDPKLIWQFAHPERLHFGKEQEGVNVFEVTPDNPKSKTPVLFGLGFSNDATTYKPNILALAEAGRRVICPNIPWGVENSIPSPDSKEYPAPILRHVTAIMEILAKLRNEKGISKVDVVAHSKSALGMVMAAHLHPEMFRNIVLVDPAGIIGEDTVPRVLHGATMNQITPAKHLERRKDLADPRISGHKDNFAKHVATVFANVPQALREISSISKSDIRQMLEDLRVKGIGISIIHGLDDEIFPMDKAQKALGRRNKDKEQEFVDGFYSVDNVHDEMLSNPLTSSKLADSALTALENRHKREKISES